VTSSFPTISKLRRLCAPIILISACETSQTLTPVRQEGTISYPFIGETRQLGNNGKRAPFVIKSAVGATEYTVEIPENGGRYDIAIPLAELSGHDAASGALMRDTRTVNPATTDKELVAALPDVTKKRPEETAMLDGAFGVGTPEGPVQSPSYTLGIAKVNQHFKEKNFEMALIELNQLLAFYPNSPKLLKMKGTLLVKTGNRDLAMRSWQRALDLTPGDASLRRSIDRLNERILAERNARELSRPKAQDPEASPGAASQSRPAH
jgi:hypothetical protein